MEIRGEKASLKVFIRLVGLLILFFLAIPFLLIGLGIIRDVFSHRWSWGLVVVPLIFGVYGIIGFLLWRKMRSDDFWTVKEYSFIQSALTGLAVGKAGNVFWPHGATFLGLIVFLIMYHFLKPFLLRYLGFPANSRGPMKMI